MSNKGKRAKKSRVKSTKKPGRTPTGRLKVDPQPNLQNLRIDVGDKKRPRLFPDPPRTDKGQSDKPLDIKPPEAIVDGEPDDAEDDGDDGDDAGAFRGFDRYGVKWDKQRVNFQVDAVDQGVRFYGWKRRTKMRGSDEIIWAIDVFAKRGDRDFTVRCITYVDRDPTLNPKSLNADICATINQWFHVHLNDNAKRLDQLVKQADHPTVKFTRIGSIDKFLIELQELRNTAISSGGTRLLELKGDRTGDPVVHLTVCLTDQAIALEGKPPPIGAGLVIDHAIATKGKDTGTRISQEPRKPGPVILKIDEVVSGNAGQLIAQLKVTKDKAQARKIRAMLRKMGHRGGAR